MIDLHQVNGRSESINSTIRSVLISHHMKSASVELQVLLQCDWNVTRLIHVEIALKLDLDITGRQKEMQPEHYCNVK